LERKGSFNILVLFQDIDECQSNPCQHEGECINAENSYTCNCIGGYSGINCQTDIDHCINVTCPGQNTECLDIQNNYTCVCKAGYDGKDILQSGTITL